MRRDEYMRKVRADARRREARSRYRPLEAPYDPKKMVVRMPLGCYLWVALLIAAVVWMIFEITR